jgi:hypothetical protein
MSWCLVGSEMCIRDSPYLAVVLALSVALGAGGALALVSHASTWLSSALYVAAVVVLVGPFVSTPGLFSSGSAFLNSWIDSVSTIVFGWKQLITIDPPVGTYHGLMMPAFLVFFVANLLAGLVVLSKSKRQWLAILPFFAMVVFAFAFGQATIDDQTNLFGFVLDVPSSFVSGLIILVASIKYLTPKPGKRPKLDFAGLRNARALARQTVQFGSSWALVLAALVVVALVLGINSASSREVLRSAPPAQFKGQDLSPLSLYRQSFTDPKKLNQAILKYSSSDANLERIRLAVMTRFNGQVFSVEDEAAHPLEFRLLPAALVANTDAAKTINTTVTLISRGSVWLPLVDNVSKVEFSGANAQSLGDHFYFNRPTNSGALLGDNVPQGDVTYKVESFVEGAAVDPASITPAPNTVCADAANADSVVPQSVCDWIDLQDEDLSNASGLEKLIKTLRARGFLSHSLDLPKGEGTWSSLLDGYTWVTAKAGHSKGRIDQMFLDLIALQQASKPGVGNAKLVATAGDDEQFATAAALVARAAGYDSRVVVGFRTATTEPNLGVAACQDSTCFGKNLTAWVEVSSAGSAWLPIDVTPQYKIQPKAPPKVNGLKQNQSEPGQDNATVVPPAQPTPRDNGDVTKVCPAAGFWKCFEWDIVWSILSIILVAGLGVLVVLGPPVAVILGKRRRRRNRENAATLAERITAAWDEYVDNLIDLGELGLRRLPANETRPELLVKAARANEALLTSGYAQAMVRFTDFAAFAPEEPNPDYEREVWTFVDTEYAKATAELSRYRKLRVQLSLRSIIYRASAPEANTVNYRRIGAEGSTLSAFVVVAKQGAIEGYEWAKPRVKKFVDARLPFLNKLVAKAAPSVNKLVTRVKRKGSDGDDVN